MRSATGPELHRAAIVVDGNLWAVGACWRAESDGWCVEAHSVDDPDGWRGGRQALSG